MSGGEAMEKRITFTMEGLPDEDGHVRLSDFLIELENLESVLRKTDRLLSPGREPSVYYRIVGLSTASPATVVIEAHPKEPDIDRGPAVVERTLSLLSSIERGEAPRRMDYALLESVRNLVTPIGKTLASVSVVSNGTTLKITPEYRAKVDLLMAPEEVQPSFVRGMLEYINIHGSQKVFRIYPDVGPTKLTCHFPEDLKSAAIAAIGKYVEVRGVFKYKAVAHFAHEVEVREIKVLPADDEIPAFESLTGSAPDLTGGLSSVDFVRTIRRGET
jgi:hypothetical protein